MIIYIYIYICCFLSNHLLRFVATIFGVFVGCFQILINKRRVKTCRDYPSGCSLAIGGLGWALGVTLDYLMHGLENGAIYPWFTLQWWVQSVLPWLGSMSKKKKLELVVWKLPQF